MRVPRLGFPNLTWFWLFRVIHKYIYVLDRKLYRRKSSAVWWFQILLLSRKPLSVPWRSLCHYMFGFLLPKKRVAMRSSVEHEHRSTACAKYQKSSLAHRSVKRWCGHLGRAPSRSVDGDQSWKVDNFLRRWQNSIFAWDTSGYVRLFCILLKNKIFSNFIKKYSFFKPIIQYFINLS